MIENLFLGFFAHLRLKKEEKKTYYRTPPLVCKNCHKLFRGYILKGTYIIDLSCPNCDCRTVIQQKEIK